VGTLTRPIYIPQLIYISTLGIVFCHQKKIPPQPDNTNPGSIFFLLLKLILITYI